MDELGWLQEGDPLRLLDHLFDSSGLVKRPAGRRKARLILCAFHQTAWPNPATPQDKGLVELAEQFADGKADKPTVEPAVRAFMDRMLPVLLRHDGTGGPIFPGTEMFLLNGSIRPVMFSESRRITKLVPPQLQCSLIRCIVGNPFKPLFLAPAVLSWHGATVVKMATAIYEERKWNELPVLADALEDAGVTDPAILDHCRGSGPHARGCFVVDAILGRCWPRPVKS